MARAITQTGSEAAVLNMNQVCLELGQLESVFEELASEGQLPREALVKLVRRLTVSEEDAFTEVELEEALGDVRIRYPDRPCTPDFLTLDEVRDVVQLLCGTANWRSESREELLEGTPKLTEKRTGGALSSTWRWVSRTASRLWGACRRQDGEEVYEKRMKPTTKLVISVVIMSLIMAMAVAGTAIGLSWSSTMTLKEKQLQHELTLVHNALSSFTVVQAREKALSNQRSTTFMLSAMVEQIGYNVNLRTTQDHQSDALQLSARVIDDLYEGVSLDRALTRVTMMANALSEACVVAGVTTANSPQIINRINQNRLSEGYEMILVQKPSGPNSTAAVTNTLRYCPAGNCTLSSEQQRAIQLAFSSQSGSMQGVSYTGLPSYIAYIPVDCLNDTVLIFSVTSTALIKKFMPLIIASTSAANANTRAQGLTTLELLVVSQTAPGTPLTTINSSLCSGGTCVFDQASAQAISAAIRGVSASQVVSANSYQGKEVLAVAALLPRLNTTLVTEVAMDELRNDVINDLGGVGDAINAELNGTSEVVIARQVSINGTTRAQLLTKTKFNCSGGPCPVLTPSASVTSMSTIQCLTGASKETDYRGVSVLAAYSCVPDLKLGIVLKMDDQEVINDSIAQAAQYANDQNSQESGSLELLVGTQYQGRTDAMRYVSNFKYRDTDCSEELCVSTSAAAHTIAQALAAKSAAGQLIRGVDYRGEQTILAVDMMPELGIAFLLKIDVSEVEWPLIVNLLILLGTAIGITLLGVVGLGLSARHMINTIEDTWERGRAEVQKQKESFEKLVSALYPSFASERLLAGDAQIVVEVPKAAIYFSDICNFTAQSNTLSAMDMLSWIGYNFRVIDHCAAHYGIHKIKTIGDAYLAIAGLPQRLEDDGKGTDLNHALQMVHFASTVVQLFSGRYVHPDATEVLKMVAERSVLQRKTAGRTAARPRRTSHSSRVSSDKQSSIAPRSVVESESGRKFTCAMRFGLAMGPITAGVLQGTCPAFDIWGKTVNLASRMESSGVPGNVQCTEGVYQAVAGNPDCPVIFDKPHTTYAKGFGNIIAYNFRATTSYPPKKILEELGIELRTDIFIFEGVQKLKEADAQAQAQAQVQACGGEARPATRTSSITPSMDAPTSSIYLFPAGSSSSVTRAPGSAPAPSQPTVTRVQSFREQHQTQPTAGTPHARPPPAAPAVGDALPPGAIASETPTTP